MLLRAVVYLKAFESKVKEVFDTVEESRELSVRDRDQLLIFLKNAPEPNEALKTAYQKVFAMYQIDDNSRAVYNVDSSLVKNPDDQV